MKSNHFLRVIIFLLVLFVIPVVHATAVNPVNARAWADKNGRLLLEAFHEQNISERYKKLDNLFYELVDVEYVAKFVMGKYWRIMSEEQRELYQDLFERYVLAVYKTFPLDFAQSLTYNVGNAVVEKDFTTVSAVVAVTLNPQDGQQEFILQFRLHQKNDKILLVDIKLAESSLILSYRNKFTRQIAELEGEIDWFLEDFEMSTRSLEQANLRRSAQAEY